MVDILILSKYGSPHSPECTADIEECYKYEKFFKMAINPNFIVYKSDKQIAESYYNQRYEYFEIKMSTGDVFKLPMSQYPLI